MRKQDIKTVVKKSIYFIHIVSLKYYIVFIIVMPSPVQLNKSRNYVAGTRIADHCL